MAVTIVQSEYLPGSPSSKGTIQGVGETVTVSGGPNFIKWAGIAYIGYWIFKNILDPNKDVIQSRSRELLSYRRKPKEKE